MDYRDSYLLDHVTDHLRLGDARADLQFLLDNRIPIPSGFYMVAGNLWMPKPPDIAKPSPGSVHPGGSTFISGQTVQVAHRKCGTVQEWFAPAEYPRWTNVPLDCRTCGTAWAAHDEVEGREYHMTMLGPLRNGPAPVAV